MSRASSSLDPDAIRSGNRRALAKAITLLESSRPADQAAAQRLLETLLPDSGHALRLGVTGVPGVGKSTFIESFGLHLIEQGHRVAILAVDPTSPVTGGSILGDKTRMPELSRHPAAFIRPSPASGILGGVARRTRETLLLCEAAGYDVVLVETVGVGQSETLVASMVDCFLMLMLPNAGDELQGIKKGIVEVADLLVVNKADGDQIPLAKSTQQAYRQALRLVRSKASRGALPVLTCSALERSGLGTVWEAVRAFAQHARTSGAWEQQRRTQARQWLRTLVEEGLLREFRSRPDVQDRLQEYEQAVEDGELLPTQAAERLLHS
ncbi:MAG TPA: methylmalonyl Co-A mutase-associated GTPase MeaB [Deltaproteobacteria bacterium]|nr:methylmalonyl Co-A mutase-associated GTPase MeaB [Deltaproteobacteria bacterium]